MKIAKTRVVFDRHNTATRKTAASVYIEVSYDRVRNFYNTGIRLCAGQFKDGRVINHGQMAEYQQRINDMRSEIEDYITAKIKAKEEFTLEGLKQFMDGRVTGTKDSFLRFMLKRINERPIKETTRKSQMSVYNTLRRWGHIRQFGDITDANIRLWDDLAHQNAEKRKSVWNYHKILKIYIREAIEFGHITDNPYTRIKPQRDNPTGHRYLTQEELDRIKSLPLPEKPLRDARMCFLFQCYTSMAYADMKVFDIANARRIGGRLRMRDNRVKTGEEYNITLLKPVLDILKECNYRLPVQSDQYYNRNLQVIQFRAGIQTHLTSHVGRHTFATSIALKNKIPVEVLQKIMGHNSIKTTQIYAKVLQESVDEAFDQLNAIL